MRTSLGPLLDSAVFPFLVLLVVGEFFHWLFSFPSAPFDRLLDVLAHPLPTCFSMIFVTMIICCGLIFLRFRPRDRNATCLFKLLGGSIEITKKPTCSDLFLILSPLVAFWHLMKPFRLLACRASFFSFVSPESV